MFLIRPDLRQIFQDQWLWIYIVRYVFRVVTQPDRLSVYSQPHYFKIYNTILKKRRCGDSTYILLCCLTPSHMTQMPYDFQQRMSWLPQRWRTQRNAIRNAIRISSRIIKSLNAHCTSGNCREYAYLSVRKPHSTNSCCISSVVLEFGAAGLVMHIINMQHLLLLHLKYRALRA